MDQTEDIEIDGISFDCICPKCSHETGKTAAYIRQFSQYVCPACESIVPVVDRREILKALIIGEKVIELAQEIRKPKAVP